MRNIKQYELDNIYGGVAEPLKCECYSKSVFTRVKYEHILGEFESMYSRTWCKIYCCGEQDDREGMMAILSTRAGVSSEAYECATKKYVAAKL